MRIFEHSSLSPKPKPKPYSKQQEARKSFLKERCLVAPYPRPAHDPFRSPFNEGFRGLGVSQNYRDIITIMGNQMDKKMENEMEAIVYRIRKGLSGSLPKMNPT